MPVDHGGLAHYRQQDRERMAAPSCFAFLLLFPDLRMKMPELSPWRPPDPALELSHNAVDLALELGLDAPQFLP